MTRRQFTAIFIRIVCCLFLIKVVLPVAHRWHVYLLTPSSILEVSSPIYYVLFWSAIFAFARLIADKIIFEDKKINLKLFFIRLLISIFLGIIIGAWRYTVTYPLRADFYEKTHYPPSMLTLEAIVIGLFSFISILTSWYLLPFIYKTIKNLITKFIQPTHASPGG